MLTTPTWLVHQRGKGGFTNTGRMLWNHWAASSRRKGVDKTMVCCLSSSRRRLSRIASDRYGARRYRSYSATTTLAWQIARDVVVLRTLTTILGALELVILDDDRLTLRASLPTNTLGGVPA
eukprot:scaffold269661_cov34-Prasinocladus_malaysianus.AAC.1